MKRKLMACAVTLCAAAALSGCGPKEPLEPDAPGKVATTAPDASLGGLNEVDLVERVARARAEYRESLEVLHSYYVKHGYYDKQVWSEKERNDLRKARKYLYLAVADLPPTTQRAEVTSVPQADELYNDALEYYKHLPLPLMYDREKMKVALGKFNRIINDYANSDKVDDAYFYAAEILKEYLNENVQAVEYYKRAYETDPNTPHPAHFQRAAVLDYRLHQRDEALKEYRLTVQVEGKRSEFWAKSNADYAATRIKQLAGE